MATVIVELWHKEQKLPQDRAIRVNDLRQHSLKLRRDLDAEPPNADGSLKPLKVHGSFGPMIVLLDALRDRGHARKFEVHFASLPIENVAMLWEATVLLEIVPHQYKLRVHIRGAIAHDTMTVDQLITLHRVFYETKEVVFPRENQSVWNLLVHHTAWFIDDGSYTAEEAGNMESRLIAEHPKFAEAVDKKIQSLQKGRENFAEREKRKAAKEVNKRVRAHKKEQRDRLKHELEGDNVQISDGMARMLLTRPEPGMTAVVQEGKHGKRRPPGQGKRSKKAEEGGEKGE